MATRILSSVTVSRMACTSSWMASASLHFACIAAQAWCPVPGWMMPRRFAKAGLMHGEHRQPSCKWADIAHGEQAMFLTLTMARSAEHDLLSQGVLYFTSAQARAGATVVAEGGCRATPHIGRRACQRDQAEAGPHSRSAMLLRVSGQNGFHLEAGAAQLHQESAQGHAEEALGVRCPAGLASCSSLRHMGRALQLALRNAHSALPTTRSCLWRSGAAGPPQSAVSFGNPGLEPNHQGLRLTLVQACSRCDRHGSCACLHMRVQVEQFLGVAHAVHLEVDQVAGVVALIGLRSPAADWSWCRRQAALQVHMIPGMAAVTGTEHSRLTTSKLPGHRASLRIEDQVQNRMVWRRRTCPRRLRRLLMFTEVRPLVSSSNMKRASALPSLSSTSCGVRASCGSSTIHVWCP